MTNDRHLGIICNRRCCLGEKDARENDDDINWL